MKALRLISFCLALALAGPLNAEPIERSSQSGPVEVRIRLEPGEPVIGDVLVLRLEVRAEPDVELLMPVFGEALDRYGILDFVPTEELDDAGGTRATQVYRLQAARSGPQNIPPILVEFVDRRAGHSHAPEGRDAYELLTERIDFTVSSVLPEGAEAQLERPLGPLGPRLMPAGPLWPWILGIVALLAGVAPFAWRAWTRRSLQVRRRSAYEIARGRLEKIMAGPLPASPIEIDVFFVELSSIVRHYLEDRFELRSPELTTEEFLESMSGSPDLTVEHQRELQGFLARADLVKFARLLPSEQDVRDSIQSAERFLEETRHRAPAQAPSWEATEVAADA